MLTENVNFKLKKTFVPMYEYISTNNDNQLFITKSAKQVRMKVLPKTDENYISFHIGYAIALDVFSFFHAHSLDAISKTLNDKKCVKLNQFKLNR